MITLRTNIGAVAARLRAKILSVQDKDKMLRLVAVNALPEVIRRIHQTGQDANGGQIGNYSAGYMKVRTGNYSDSRFKSGKNKGKFREKKKRGQAGTFTRGKHKGEQRPVYNKTSDTTVIAELTGWMRQHFVVIADGNKYGLGFLNEPNPDDADKKDAPSNAQKAKYIEAIYNKKIWKLSQPEKESALNRARKFIRDSIHK